MNSLAKKVSDSVLSSLTNDLKPDVPAYNRLKRSWVELEKQRASQVLQLRHNKEQIATRTHRTIQSLASAEDATAAAAEQSRPPADCVPGFRYKANGDTKQSTEETRKLILMKSLTGLSKHVFEMKPWQKSQPELTAHKPSTHSAGTPDTAQGEETESCAKKHSRSTVLLDEDSFLRVRKVQEQLGLCSQLGDSNKTRGLHNPEQAFRRMHRNSTTDREADKSQNNRGLREKTTVMKGGEWCASWNTGGEATATCPSSVTSVRLRCGACKCVARSEVQDLVRCSNPTLFDKPRWRHPPSGRYVPPPATRRAAAVPASCHTSRSGSKGKDGSERSLPALRRGRSGAQCPSRTQDHKREERAPGDSVLAWADSAGKTASTALQSTSDKELATASPSLVACRRKNSQENKMLQEKMQLFLSSLPEKQSPPPPVPVPTV